MNQADAKRAVLEARVARMATINHLGAVDLVPIAYAMSGDMLVTTLDEASIGADEVKHLETIRNHPEVTIVVDHYDDDWSKRWWVRMRGRAKVLTSGARYEAVLDDLAAKYSPVANRRPKCPALEIDITGWNWGEPPV